MPRGRRGNRSGSKRGQAGSSNSKANPEDAPVQKRRRVTPPRGSETDPSWRRSPSPLSDLSNEASDISDHNDPHGPYIPTNHPPAVPQQIYPSDPLNTTNLGASDILQALASSGGYNGMVSQDMLNQVTALMVQHGNPDALLQLLSAALQDQQNHQQQPTFQEQQQAFAQILQNALSGAGFNQGMPTHGTPVAQPGLARPQVTGGAPGTHAAHSRGMGPQQDQGHLLASPSNYHTQTKISQTTRPAYNLPHAGSGVPYPQAPARPPPPPQATVSHAQTTVPSAPPSYSTQEAPARVAQRSVMEAKRQKELAIEKARESSSFFVGRDSEYDNFIIPSIPRATVLQRLHHKG